MSAESVPIGTTIRQVRLKDLTSGGAGGDSDAIHDNVAGEIVAITEKTTLVANDEVIIEDSADSNNKKSAKLSNVFGLPTVSIPMSLTSYEAQPAKSSESNIHGGFLSLATAGNISIPSTIVVTKGIGKLVVVVNAGVDLIGDIVVTGTTVDRDTGATTPVDEDVITVDALTTDNSDTDGNGNTRHSFTGAYITSKWFTGTATLSTADLNLTDVDVYHCSFEQLNDSPNLVLNTFDVNLFSTNHRAEFDAYLYCLEVTADKCDIIRCASLNLGTNGETAITNKYWRLRRGNIAQALDGTTDGIWADVFYTSAPTYIEDVTMKIWITKTQSLTV